MSGLQEEDWGWGRRAGPGAQQGPRVPQVGAPRSAEGARSSREVRGCSRALAMQGGWGACERSLAHSLRLVLAG